MAAQIDLTLEQAVAAVLGCIRPVEETEEAGLLCASGRVAAEDIYAPFANPPFDRSPLDGYALRSADIRQASAANPVRLRVIGEVCAGQVFPDRAAAGEAVRVMTGAKLPAACDCVIRQEDVKLWDAQGRLVDGLPPEKVLQRGDAFSAEISYALQHHQNYCYAGEDIQQGACLIREGTVLKAAQLGVLASMGIARVRVWCRPRIVLCSTGDELLMPGEALQEGKIYNSNLFLLAARLQELGFAAEILGCLPDDAQAAAAQIRSFEGRAELFLSTGGVSVGKKDIMHAVVRELSAEQLFWRMAMKPGAPALAYRYGSLPGIALSGNPFAALATFELLVRPVLARLSHRPQLVCARRTAILQDDFLKKSQGRRFVRACYADGRVSLPGRNASGMLFSAMACNAMLDIPAGSGELHAGDPAEIVCLY